MFDDDDDGDDEDDDDGDDDGDGDDDDDEHIAEYGCSDREGLPPFSIAPFSDASSHLYKRVCPSICPSIGPSVRPSVNHRHCHHLTQGGITEIETLNNIPLSHELGGE